MSGPTLVRVAVPRAVAESFTYGWPAGLGRAEAGCQVIVPFGPDLTTGVVVGPGDAGEVPEGRLREVVGVVEGGPALSPDLLELGRFIAGYYLCPLGLVLKAMLPGGPEAALVARLTDRGRLALAGGVRGARRRRVLEALAEGGPVELPRLRRRVGTGLTPALRELGREGWVELSERITGARPRRLRIWRRAVEVPTGDALAAVLGRSEVRREVLLAVAPEGSTAAELAERVGRPAGSVRGALDRLAAAGVLEAASRRVDRRPPGLPDAEPPKPRRPTREQGHALVRARQLVDAGEFAVLLIEGVTGSGKTEVYMRALERALELGRTGLYLVPEIAITPLLMRAVRARFGERTAVLHSALSRGQRHDERARILRGEVDVVLGARSAVFAPLPRLGLIVVDEEHEPSYKQDSQPRYHGRDVAVMRGRLERVPVVLGSATPSLESYHNARTGRYGLCRMTARAGGSRPATVEVVDMREEFRARPAGGPLSQRLRQALDEVLAEGRQAMILLNRRGWAEFLLCRECGEVERCERCAVSLTVHLSSRLLRCHHCDARRRIPDACPACGGTFLQNVGRGTEQLEVELDGAFPGISVARLDRDVARRRGEAARVLADFERGRSKVLVGTQMIAKGHDFPGVTLVGVLQADRALWLPDFRAAERTFQLITQVAGRSGRRRQPGRVIVQTYTPDHPAIELAVRQEYPPFYESESRARRSLAYPPFSHLVGLLVSSSDPEAAEGHARTLAAALRAATSSSADVLGPAPAPLPRLQDRWRHQVLLKAARRASLSAAVRSALAASPRPEGVQVDVDVDPQSLL